MAFKVEITGDIYHEGLRINSVTSVTTQNTEQEIVQEAIRVLNLDHYEVTRDNITNELKKVQTGYWLLELQKGTYNMIIYLKLLSK